VKKNIHIHVSQTLRRSPSPMKNPQESDFQTEKALRLLKKVQKNIPQLSLTTIVYIAADLGMKKSELMKEMEEIID
jgi:hypothetical protein